MLELPGAWEPPCSHCSLSLGEGKAPKILFLMEAKQTVDEMRRIQAKLQYHSMIIVPCVQRAGGLAMLWKQEVDLYVQTYSLNHIDAHVMTDLNSPWRITGFYGRLEEHRKQESWGYLRNLQSRSSLPWFCIRDYIEILSFNEKQGRIPRSNRLMGEFRSVLMQHGLIDLGFYGNIFTWRNGRPGEAFVQERLDRAYATIEWRALFPCSKVTHLQASYSDHDPIMLTTSVDTQVTGRIKVPKRFKKKWATHPKCKGIIHEAWNGVISTGSPMYILFEEIKTTRMSFTGWSRKLGNLKTMVEEKKLELEHLTVMNNANNLDVIQKVKDEIKEDGVMQKLMLQRWPKITSKNYSLLVIRLI